MVDCRKVGRIDDHGAEHAVADVVESRSRAAVVLDLLVRALD